MKRLIYGSLVYITMIFLNISIFSYGDNIHYGQYIQGHHVHSCPSNVVVMEETNDTHVPKRCPEHMQAFKGYCYIHSYTMIQFKFSVPYCQNSTNCGDTCDYLGSKLVVVDNPDLSCFLHDSLEVIKESYFYGVKNLDDKRVKIGLRRTRKDANWWEFEWVDGSPYDHMPAYCGGSSPWGYERVIRSYGINHYGDRDCPRDCNQSGLGTIGRNRLCYPSKFYNKSNVCVLSNHSNKKSVYWEPKKCSENIPYVCERKAYCEPGYYLSRSQRKNPYFQNELLAGIFNGAGPVLGECKICPLGTYHEQRFNDDNDSECKPCKSGYIGILGAINDTCGGPCPDGNCSGMTNLNSGNETVVPHPTGA